MNKKGFTLIELIATIALLGVIAIIAFVSINKILKKGKISDCKNLIKGIQTAATEYVSDNRYSAEFLRNVTEQRLSINAQTLITGNYLSSPIKDPFTKEDMDPSTITMKIDLYDDYTVKTVEISAPDNLENCSE